MNRTLFLLLAILFSASSLFAGAPSDLYKTAWLKRGCVALLVLQSGNKSAFESGNMYEDCITVTAWMNGFLVGVNGATFIPKEHYDLFFPPEEWLNSTKIASSILDYIEKNKEFIKPTTSARKVMMSWYLTNHPKSGDREKALAESLLKD